MKKISILALHLGFGGTESSIISISNMLCENYEVEIISTYKLQEEPAFYLNPKVKVKYLMTDLKPNVAQLKQAIKSFNIIQIIKQAFISAKVLYLRRKLMIDEIKKLDSDVIFTTRYFHNKWSGKYGKKSAVKIAQEHNYHNNNQKYINKTLRCIKNIDYFLPVSKELTDFYAEKLKGTKTKCIYIPHSLDDYPSEVSSLESKNIISVGRLSKEKGYLDLVEAFSKVHEKHPDWKLNIVGDGAEKEQIINKIKQKNLESSVILRGYLKKEDIYKMYLDSSIFVMTSYTESFGLVLIEAESHGIPILALDSAHGAREIIENNKNGYLIKDRNLNLLADKINELIEDKDLRKKLGEQGRILSEKYKKENISKEWNKFLEDAIE